MKFFFILVLFLLSLSCTRNIYQISPSSLASSDSSFDTRYRKTSQEMCEEIYNRREDHLRCKEFSNREISNLFELYKILENPRDDTLKKIEFVNFEIYLNISLKSFERLIEDYDSSDAREILSWLISSYEELYFFVERDEKNDYKLSHKLLEAFENSYRSFTSLHKAFTKHIRGQALIELIIDRGDEVFKLFFYIINENTICDDRETRDCFKIYCQIGEELHENYRQDMLDIEVFEAYIKDIIDEKINSRNYQPRNDEDGYNPNGWRHKDSPGIHWSEIGDVRDLHDWVDDLCQDLV
ncbi:MAG: hypothetical protein GDA46_07130 [Bdellovibrionales bacterium]|nr:hypothetical protein [Bdellovibrionales bacterium]